jgi:hypothetical protein
MSERALFLGRVTASSDGRQLAQGPLASRVMATRIALSRSRLELFVASAIDQIGEMYVGRCYPRQRPL